jgi:hypothetical protein
MHIGGTLGAFIREGYLPAIGVSYRIEGVAESLAGIPAGGTVVCILLDSDGPLASGRVVGKMVLRPVRWRRVGAFGVTRPEQQLQLRGNILITPRTETFLSALVKTSIPKSGRRSSRGPYPTAHGNRRAPIPRKLVPRHLPRTRARRHWERCASLRSDPALRRTRQCPPYPRCRH